LSDNDAVRVLFTTTPGWGHVHPMVPLAKAFVDRGDDVAWAVATEVVPRLEKVGFTVHAAGLGMAENLREFQRRFPEVESLPPAARPDFMFPRVFGALRAAPMLADLSPVAQDFRPDVIVNDQADFAGPIVAAAMGVPNVTHSFGRLLPRRRVEEAGENVAPLWQAHGLHPRPFGGTYDHLYLDIYPGSLQATEVGHVSSVQLLRPVAFATGPEEPLPDWITADSESPLVYVTFGTVFNTNAPLVSTVVAALRELAVRVVVTLGPNGDPELLGPQPANVHITGYIPQTHLLPHCTAVVSHAGSGTLLAALGHGLPQLCLPQAADQFGNAAACVGAGAGRELQPGTVTVGNVCSEVRRLLDDPSFRKAAETVRAEIHHMPAPAEVADIIAARYS